MGILQDKPYTRRKKSLLKLNISILKKYLESELKKLALSRAWHNKMLG